jgi:hypothetical protein
VTHRNTKYNKTDRVKFTKYHNNAIANLVTPNCTVCMKNNYANKLESRGVWELNYKGRTIFLCDGCKSYLDHLEAQYDRGNLYDFEEYIK